MIFYSLIFLNNSYFHTIMKQKFDFPLRFVNEIVNKFNDEKKSKAWQQKLPYKKS